MKTKDSEIKISDESIHIPVFYEGQDDLIDILATSMVSVCYNTKSFIDFYILDCGICDFNKKMLETLKERFHNFSIEYIPVDLKQFEGLRGWGSGNFLDVYARLLIPDVKKNLDRIIYLDSDVIALDDVKKLWDINLGKYVYGAVPDLGYRDIFFENCTKKLGISPKHIYPNAGVLLLNTKKCREIDFTKKILKLARNKKDDIWVINEDLLSMFFGCNNYKILDNRYNLTDRSNEIAQICAPKITDKYLENEWKHIVFQHLSPGKAWKMQKNNQGRDLKLFDAFWFFASMTPFHDGLTKKFFTNINSIHTNILLGQYHAMTFSKKTLKLFGFIPIIKVVQKGLTKKYKLFNLFTILKIKTKNIQN